MPIRIKHACSQAARSPLALAAFVLVVAVLIWALPLSS